MKQLLVIFVVSWTTGYTYPVTPCVGKEPENYVCAKKTPQRKEHVFKSEDAANGFMEVMKELKAEDIKLETRKK